MRTFLFAVAALAGGMVLGAWQPRGELLAARAALAELADQPCRRSAADRVRSLLTADRPSLAPPVRPEAGDVAAAPSAEAEAEGAEVEPHDEDATPPAAPDPEQQKRLMRDALGARRSQARQALREQADLDDEELAEVDAVMAEMNAQLKVEVDAFVEDALARGDLERRDMMAIAANSLDIMIAADDRLAEILPPDAEIDDEARDPLSYIDAATIESLTRLEGFADPEEP